MSHEILNKVSKRLNKKEVLTIPNLLSFFRIILIPIIVYLYVYKQKYFGAVCVIILSAITDIADGKIARKFNMTSDLGKLLDPIADKLTQGAVLICLTSRYPKIKWLVGVFAVKEFLMLVLGGIVLKYTDTVNSAKWYGKACTVMLELFMAIVILFNNIPVQVVDYMIIICIAAILVSFALYINFYGSIIKSNRKN